MRQRATRRSWRPTSPKNSSSSACPFRTAHHRVGAFVKYCREHGKALDEVTLGEMKETIPEATPEFLTLFDPVASVAKRNITGGTGFEQVAKQLDFWKKSLEF